MAIAVLSATGCPAPPRPPVPRPQPVVRVRSFTEATEVPALAVVRPFALAGGERGLDAWNLRTSDRVHLGVDDGLPSDHVTALAPDGQRRAVWVVTDGGVARYDVDAAALAPLVPPPATLRPTPAIARAVAPAGDGGAWVGDDAGLLRADPQGGWRSGGVDRPVVALWRGREGPLWIGTPDGITLARDDNGTQRRFGRAEGCELDRIRFIGPAPDGGPIIVGALGHEQRIAVVLGGKCATFRASPGDAWLGAVRHGDRVAVLTSRRIYELALPSASSRRSLQRDGMRLVAVGPGGRGSSPYVLRAIDGPVPAGALTLASAEDEILLGTRDLGVARVPAQLPGPTSWLRRRELLDGANRLSVACAAPADCYVATGGPGVWRFDGDRFARSGEDAATLAVVRSPDGDVYALRRSDEPRRLRVARVAGGAWEDLGALTVDTPEGIADLTFARFAPSGVLWLGLRYRDEQGEMQPYGVALVDLGMGAVAYYHASADSAEAAHGVLPIPIGVVDAAFLGQDEVWLATSEGAARLRGNDIMVFTEVEGLLSELVRGVEVSAGGVVFVATGSGVGVYDGDTWSFPRTLRRNIEAITLGLDGRLWMATHHGLIVFDGAEVRRLDQRRGLLDDDVAHVAADSFGRIWASTEQGISLVTY